MPKGCAEILCGLSFADARKGCIFKVCKNYTNQMTLSIRYRKELKEFEGLMFPNEMKNAVGERTLCEKTEWGLISK